MKSKKTKEEKTQDALYFSSNWLAKGNEYEERGQHEKAGECYEKSARWLMRYNKLIGDG